MILTRSLHSRLDLYSGRNTSTPRPLRYSPATFSWRDFVRNAYQRGWSIFLSFGLKKAGFAPFSPIYHVSKLRGATASTSECPTLKRPAIHTWTLYRACLRVEFGMTGVYN